MLSSVASRCYWSARYLERAENMARLLGVYSTLLLDLPKEAGVDWPQLMTICGADAGFAKYRRWPLERNAVRFLTSELDNPGSIISSVHHARENLRTLRDIVPNEAFQAVNEFYLYSNDRLKRATNRRARFGVLQDVVRQCQQLTGLLASTMSHNEAYQFIRLGRNLERADMTTRILDVAGDLLESDSASREEYETVLWVNVLRSLSAYQAYRQGVRSRISPVRVVHFLMMDAAFPRTVLHCLNELDSSSALLPGNTGVMNTVESVRGFLSELSLRELVRESLHAELDTLQERLGEIHNAVTQAWFMQQQTQDQETQGTAMSQTG